MLKTQLEIKYVGEGDITPYHGNARTHSADQIEQIKASIKEFGMCTPIGLHYGTIVYGHARFEAMKQLGYKEFPVVDLSHMTKTQMRAYVLADNQLALNAGWSIEMLTLELQDLKADDFDISLLGFSADELNDMLGSGAQNDKDPDEVPAVPEVAYSKLGDMWILGPHRVRCGDSTVQSDWNALMRGELADIQACDPPYNVNYESDLAGSIQNDNMGNEQFREFLFKFYSCSFQVMKPGAAIYVAHSDSEGINFRTTFIEAGFKLSGCLTWKKNNLVIGRLDYQPISEPILYGWKTGSKHRWYGGRKNITVQEVGEQPPFEQLGDGNYAVRYGDRILYVKKDAVFEEKPTSVIHHDKPKRSALHPTMKPVGLWERLIKNSARAGDIVIDGFGGSGTTLIAADRLGMSARLMEFDPRFCDTIVTRWQQWTGRKAVHAETGEEFPEDVSNKLIEKWGES